MKLFFFFHSRTIITVLSFVVLILFAGLSEDLCVFVMNNIIMTREFGATIFVVICLWGFGFGRMFMNLISKLL